MSKYIKQLKHQGFSITKQMLLHSSQKPISENDPRVIHLEFCNQEIPMKWLEKK